MAFALPCTVPTMLRAAAASTALAFLMLAPAVADAGRVLVKPVKKAAALKAERDAQLPGTLRDGLHHELGIARAFEKQEALGPVKGRGVFQGKSRTTGARRVTHLELVDDAGDASGPGLRIRSQGIDGDVDETPVERVFRPIGGSRAAVPHQAADGSRFLLVTGRGFFDYHDVDFEGDPEVGFGPAPTPTPAP